MNDLDGCPKVTIIKLAYQVNLDSKIFSENRIEIGQGITLFVHL